MKIRVVFPLTEVDCSLFLLLLSLSQARKDGFTSRPKQAKSVSAPEGLVCGRLTGEWRDEAERHSLGGSLSLVLHQSKEEPPAPFLRHLQPCRKCLASASAPPPVQPPGPHPDAPPSRADFSKRAKVDQTRRKRKKGPTVYICSKHQPVFSHASLVCPEQDLERNLQIQAATLAAQAVQVDIDVKPQIRAWTERSMDRSLGARKKAGKTDRDEGSTWDLHTGRHDSTTCARTSSTYRHKQFR